MKTGIVLALSGLLALSPVVASAQSQQVAAQPQQTTGAAAGGEASGAVLAGIPLAGLVVGAVVVVAGLAVVVTSISSNSHFGDLR